MSRPEIGNPQVPELSTGSATDVPIPHGRAGALNWVRSSNPGLLLMALVVGAGAGCGAIGFRWLIKTFTLIFSGHADYSATPGAPHPLLPHLGRWFLLVAPIAAGLIYGPLVQRFAREARGHGVPEVMFAVARRGGRIAPQVALVKALASALCIGGGGSVGREGPIVQIGSALGSTLGRTLRVTETRMRVLVACGAAGGIAATFNAPLAGVFFAMELILRDFTAAAFGMVVASSVTASVIGRAALGNTPFLTLPAFSVGHLVQYPLFAGLGLLVGAAGVGFSRVLYAIEDGCDLVWRKLRGPEWARPAVGGLALGGLLLILPQMYGVGYPVLGAGIAGEYGIIMLLILMIGKMVATSLTIGIGGSGGVFAPSLFVGAMLGSAYGEVAHHLLPGLAGPAGAYGLIGMGAVFAGAARAPITAVVIMFELTGEYSIILPLMAAIILGTGLSHLLSHDTIYTRKLLRRGVDIDEPAISAMARIEVGQVMEPVGALLDNRTLLIKAIAPVTASPHGQLGVIDENGYLGVVTARALADALADGRHDDHRIESIIESPDTIKITDPLQAALAALETAYASVPVLDEDGSHLVGWLTHQRVLAAERETGAMPEPLVRGRRAARATPSITAATRPRRG
ncbi:transport integral membrane protein [Microlunatus endophyticus]|uniref:Transport integral membrane protein n=1 Tax=Microlunatus endophyticus TaxID=1716077 RepID=A0A917W3S4_9ACTN|nr:chloride channel protein [Microlunatus endophyticus]GGL60467.1 transport integral membrane protein [Microlunatus endophyticus]